MRRIELLYGGYTFSLGGDSADEVMNVIREASTSGGHQWLTVNHGEGRAHTAKLLIGPGIPIAVVPPAPDDDEESASAAGASTQANIAPELG